MRMFVYLFILLWSAIGGDIGYYCGLDATPDAALWKCQKENEKVGGGGGVCLGALSLGSLVAEIGRRLRLHNKFWLFLISRELPCGSLTKIVTRSWTFLRSKKQIVLRSIATSGTQRNATQRIVDAHAHT